MEPQTNALPLIGRDGPQWIPIEDILFFSSNSRMVVHTTQGLFSPPVTLNDFHTLLQEYRFDKLDKSNLVNLSKIVDYNERVYYALFSNGESCYVSRRNRTKMDFLK